MKILMLDQKIVGPEENPFAFKAFETFEDAKVFKGFSEGSKKTEDSK